MKLYVVCPVCGTKLGKAEEIKAMYLQCFKCRELLIVNVGDNSVSIQKAKERESIAKQ